LHAKEHYGGRVQLVQVGTGEDYSRIVDKILSGRVPGFSKFRDLANELAGKAGLEKSLGMMDMLAYTTLVGTSDEVVAGIAASSLIDQVKNRLVDTGEGLDERLGDVSGTDRVGILSALGALAAGVDLLAPGAEALWRQLSDKAPARVNGNRSIVTLHPSPRLIAALIQFAEAAERLAAAA